MLSSGLVTVAANPYDEPVSVTCNAKAPRISQKSSFSTITNCALQVGILSEPGEGNFVLSSLKFAVEKSFLEMLTQLVSMELFYILCISGFIIVVLSLILKPLVIGIVKLKSCCQRTASGPASTPPIHTGFT